MLPTAIVLAGGLGTRLRGTVPDLPKALAPVAGRPFLHWLLEWLERQGIVQVVLAVGYRADAVGTSVGSRFGHLDIQYSREATPLGTGGALRQALALVEGPDALVLNGDTFADVELDALCAAHRASEGHVTIVTVPVPDASRYGTVCLEDDRVRDFAVSGEPGPGTINAGIYVVSTDLLADEPAGPFSFERDVLQERLANLRPLAFQGGSRFIDIGTPEDYARAQALFSGWDVRT